MSEHTPGPWTRGEGFDTGPNMAICHGAKILARVNGFGYPTGRGYHPTSDANARLIAAAPELLEALEDVEFLLRKVTINPKELPQMMDSLRRGRLGICAVIAKAKGTPANE